MDVLTYVGKNEEHVKDVFCKISGKVTSVGGGMFLRARWNAVPAAGFIDADLVGTYSQ